MGERDGGRSSSDRRDGMLTGAAGGGAEIVEGLGRRMAVPYGGGIQMIELQATITCLCAAKR
jgi:hypothetical protein